MQLPKSHYLQIPLTTAILLVSTAWLEGKKSTSNSLRGEAKRRNISISLCVYHGIFEWVEARMMKG